MTESPLTLWTIGHSTKPIDEFLSFLNAQGIQRLIDVRTVPRSRYNPQFNTETLAKSLASVAVSYQHSPDLGGLRKPKKDSLNTGWRNQSFRGYADYMPSAAFRKALDMLVTDALEQRTVIMCAEALPWRCHRSLIADALLIHGWEVRHIMSKTKADPHRMTSFARLESGLLFYPAPEVMSRLF